MQRFLTGVVILMWAGLLLGGAFRPATTAGGTSPAPRVGYPAPPLALVDVQGKPVGLRDFRGKAVFMNFWATWCPPCRMEMPEIERLASHLPPDTAILTVNATTQEVSPEAVQAFLERNGYTFPVALDTKGQGQTAYAVASFPTSFFISPVGVVTARITGPLTEGAMADYLKAARR